MIDTLRRPALLVLLVAALAFAGPIACGKRGNLEPPKGETSHYPKTYPRS